MEVNNLIIWSSFRCLKNRFNNQTPFEVVRTLKYSIRSLWTRPDDDDDWNIFQMSRLMPNKSLLWLINKAPINVQFEHQIGRGYAFLQFPCRGNFISISYWDFMLVIFRFNLSSLSYCITTCPDLVECIRFFGWYNYLIGNVCVASRNAIARVLVRVASSQSVVLSLGQNINYWSHVPLSINLCRSREYWGRWYTFWKHLLSVKSISLK